VTAVLVVIGLVIVELPFKISSVPKQGPIEIFTSYGPDQSLNEGMGNRRARNGFDLINFK
jgi:hypothetical protein